MEKIYNKLVRDNIPSIIENDGEKPIVRVLDDKEYKQSLLNKLLEEYEEVKKAENKKDFLEECADLLEVLKALIELEDSSLDEVNEIARKKAEKRGTFSKRLFLEKTIK